MHALFHGVVVVPVLTIEREEDAVPLACALFEGGLRLIEVTLRTPAALVAIAAIGRELPQIVVGAGTVQRPADVVQACAAGARFLVSPGMTAELAAAALATELPRGGRRPRAVAGPRPGLLRRRILPDRRHRRALGAGVSGLAERADGRRILDGAEGGRSRPRLGESAPARRARHGDRAAARILIGRPAAGNVEHAAGRERTLLRRQPSDQRCDLIDEHEPAHRDL